MCQIQIKIDKQAMVSDTYLESGAEASDVDNELEGKEEEQLQKQQQVSAEEEPQAATCGGGLTTSGPSQGMNTNNHPSVGPAKGLEISEALHINKDSSPLCVLIMFFTEFFLVLVE